MQTLLENLLRATGFDIFRGNKLSRMTNFERFCGINFCEKGKKLQNRETFFLQKFLPLKYAKANNKYIKYYDKNKESSYLKYWNLSNLYGWAMSRKLPASDFKYLKNYLKN